ncbi:class E sortase [Nocardioides sp. Kera G14]|uniref:class E sortase n=1 Tax=Nocardioides sp. Kera G14 TaxID=2884264 RepID=UPI001D0FB6C7|nr:sortase [Nocardioides sp. Kera G14]UDY22998.1 sortase [Nocardioides sp. Kera G14]
MTVAETQRPMIPRRRSKGEAPKRRPKLTAPKFARREIRAGETEEMLDISSSALTVVTILCLWLVFQLLFLGMLSETRSQNLLYEQYRSELAQATAPTGALDYNGDTVERGAPVAILSIPALGAQQVVVQGTSSRDLMAGPGHFPGSPMPGQQGSPVVMGRASTFGAPFRELTQLRPGDPIVVQNAEGSVTYHVLGVRRAGDPVPSAPTGTQSRLTLVTATGSGFLASLAPRDVVYVDALADKGTGTGATAAPASVDLAMARDTSVLPLLALCLAALLALVIGICVARRHFHVLLVWLVACPVAIALAWVTTDHVVALLPNLM